MGCTSVPGGLRTAAAAPTHPSLLAAPQRCRAGGCQQSGQPSSIAAAPFAASPSPPPMVISLGRCPVLRASSRRRTSSRVEAAAMAALMAVICSELGPLRTLGSSGRAAATAASACTQGAGQLQQGQQQGSAAQGGVPTRVLDSVSGACPPSTSTPHRTFMHTHGPQHTHLLQLLLWLKGGGSGGPLLRRRAIQPLCILTLLQARRKHAVGAARQPREHTIPAHQTLPHNSTACSEA